MCIFLIGFNDISFDIVLIGFDVGFFSSFFIIYDYLIGENFKVGVVVISYINLRCFLENFKYFNM